MTKCNPTHKFQYFGFSTFQIQTPKEIENLSQLSIYAFEILLNFTFLRYHSF